MCMSECIPIKIGCVRMQWCFMFVDSWLPRCLFAVACFLNKKLLLFRFECERKVSMCLCTGSLVKMIIERPQLKKIKYMYCIYRGDCSWKHSLNAQMGYPTYMMLHGRFKATVFFFSLLNIRCGCCCCWLIFLNLFLCYSFNANCFPETESLVVSFCTNANRTQP